MASTVDVSVSELVEAAPDRVRRIVDGPMRGTVTYRIEPERIGSRVTIRNVGRAPAFAPRWLLTVAMRRSLTADLRRLKQAVESRS